VKLINDQPLFIKGMGHGIDAYFLGHRCTSAMAAQQLIDVLTGTSTGHAPLHSN
jgi:hypothetical protein